MPPSTLLGPCLRAGALPGLASRVLGRPSLGAAAPVGPCWPAARRQQLPSRPSVAGASSVGWPLLQRRQLTTGATPETMLSIEAVDPAVTARRAQILEEVKRMDEKRGEQVRLSFTALNAEGKITDPHLNFTKAEIIARCSIHARDVRPLDSNNALSAGVYHGRQNLVATILPRRKRYIVLNLLYIRALILPHEVLFFDSAEGPESKLHKVFMTRLQKHLEEKLDEPFPFRVLESYLLSTASTLEAEMSLLRTQVQALLAELEQEISRDSLKGLLSVGRDLAGLGERSGLVNDAVERCLSDDDVLMQMDLSGRNLAQAELGGMDDIELLLESFSQRVEEVISEVQTTTANVNSTQEIVELSLSQTRNALLVLDLKLSLISVGMGFGTMIAGVFGMNLVSGWEDAQGVFLAVTGALFGLSALLVGLGLRKLQILRKVGLGASTAQAGVVRRSRGIERGRWFSFSWGGREHRPADKESVL